jgi:hypothetical protein
MARVLTDDLEYCRKQNACSDCHSEGTTECAVEIQKRGNLTVPCCRKHFNAHKSKLSRANARKYARSSAIKREAGKCTYKGCHHKLILAELLPPHWKRESTCGMHIAFKAFRVNRQAIVRCIEHPFSQKVGREMHAQNIIYRAGEGLTALGVSNRNIYLTRIFTTSDLLMQYDQFRGRTPRSV